MLEKELESLKRKLALNEELGVVWMPDPLKGVAGEVKDKTVYIYEKDREAALKVLKHEMIDYCLTSRIVNPLVDLVNLLIKSRANEIYKEKERFVDALLSLMN